MRNYISELFLISTILLYFRAIGYLPTTLIYPVLTFIFLFICIAYWAVTAMYPLVTDIFKPHVHTTIHTITIVSSAFHPWKTRNIINVFHLSVFLLSSKKSLSTYWISLPPQIGHVVDFVLASHMVLLLGSNLRKFLCIWVWGGHSV